MLYFTFTIDGDWAEYFEPDLKDEERIPKEGALLDSIQREIDVADKNLNGRFIHFVHTSPRVRDFFLEKNFRKLWKDILKNNGDTGLHCHEDDPYRKYYYQDTSKMRKVISERAKAFRKAGLDVRCYRSGFLGFSDEMVSILEENRIYLDFSCEPGRFLKDRGDLVCDWRDAPISHYRMDYKDHCKPGNSKVWEIPVGVSKRKYLYFEKSNLEELEKIALALKERSMQNRCDIVVSVLSHTYEYASSEMLDAIQTKLILLKKIGSFINIKELEDILS